MQRTVRTIDEALVVAASAVENGGRIAVQSERTWLRAAIEAAGVVEENGHLIVPVVFATETPVRRYNYRYNDYEGEYYDEVLSMDPQHCDLSRINANGPVLDSHSRYGAVGEVTLGVVVAGSATLVGTEARARLRMSNRPELASLRQDIKDGIVTNISVGYDVEEFTREESVMTNTVPVYRATRWVPTEISFVPVPADTNSGVRGAEENPPKNLITIPMKFGIRAQRNAEAGASSGGGATPAAPAATTPAAPAAAPAAEPAAAPAANAEAERSAGASSERVRILGIQTAGRALRMTETQVNEIVNSPRSLEAARSYMLETFAGQDPTATITGTNGGASVNARSQEERADQFATAAAAAVAIRARLPIELTPAERSAGNDLRGMSLLRMAEQVLSLQGVSTSGSGREIAQRAMRSQGRAATGMLTTSDLPMILQSVAQRTLRAEYAQADNTFAAWATRGTLNDFRTAHRVAATGLLKDFAKVAENGEYTYNTMAESAEAIALGKYGSIMALSWEAIINDDLDLFSRLPRAMARKSLTLQGNLVYGVLTKNPTMGDGVKLFDAKHGNLGAASKINVTSLGAAVKAFRTQKAPGEKVEMLNIKPKFILVGPDTEQFAIQFLSSDYTPTKPEDVNIYRGQFGIIVDSRIQGNAWYMAANPADVDTVEYAFLAGEDELFTEEQWNFNRDAYEIKGRTVMGVAPVDFRGLYYNPGA